MGGRNAQQDPRSSRRKELHASPSAGTQASSLKSHQWKIILGVLVLGSLALKLAVIGILLSGSQCKPTLIEPKSLQNNGTSKNVPFQEGKISEQGTCNPPQSFLHANVILDHASASPELKILSDQKSVVLDTHYSGSSYAHACVRAQEGFTSGKHWWEMRVLAGDIWSLGLVRESLYSSRLVPDLDCMPWLLGNCWGPACPYPLIANSPLNVNIRVLLDYEKGLVFFDINRFLITVLTTSFSSERIYPLFCLGDGAALRLSSAEQPVTWIDTIYFS